MTGGHEVSPLRGAGEGAAARTLERTQWRQLALITAGAIALFLALRALPTGTNLSHMDFRVDPKAGKSIEFCDPSNPQFIPVVAVKSPVVMTVSTASPARAGGRVQCTVRLHTASGKPIAAEDLVYSHTRKMHLLIVDESLEDYQHVHPDAGPRPGEWAFSFTPHRAGGYRVFADFTPAATGRGLYASVDLPVGGAGDSMAASAGEQSTAPAQLPAARSETGPANPQPAIRNPQSPPRRAETAVERKGYRFTLTPQTPPIRAGRPAELALAIRQADGGVVPLEPVMDALAHLVAFDSARSGFAHLHPVQSDVDRSAGDTRPVLRFQLMIPSPGAYVIWAQVNLAGEELFVPFWFDVESA